MCLLCDEATEVLLMGSPPGPAFAHGVKYGASPLVLFLQLFRNVTFRAPLVAPPANVGDTDSISDPGRSHILQGN